MARDDSFKKPGAIPFKWEIRPGVPKIQRQPPSPSPSPSPSHNLHCSLVQQHQQIQQSINHQRSFPRTLVNLSPPPSGFHFHPPPPEPRARSSWSVPSCRYDRCRFDPSILARPDTVASGCFLSLILLIRPKGENRRIRRSKPASDPEPNSTPDLATRFRKSESTWKSLSWFCDSPLSSSSSFSSYKSSPRPVSDAEWAGFGFF